MVRDDESTHRAQEGRAGRACRRSSGRPDPRIPHTQDPRLHESIGRHDIATTVIFNSRSNLDVARAFKNERRYKNVLVIVMTGLVPEDEVVILDKAWIPDLDIGVILR